MALEEQNNADQTLDAASFPSKSPGPVSPDPQLQTTQDVNTTIAAPVDATFPPRRPAIIVPEIDGYEITGRLGEGGMGVVWKATQHGTHRPVALKLMSAASFGSERARLRFQREVDLTARLEHPHIARVYDGGEHRGICYYAMEFIDGVPLDQHIRQQKFARQQIIELMKVICEAVQYAHQKGVIHRDLKPANILVDKEGKPRVLDFGLAKALSDDDGQMLSMDTGAAGTPAYMSPEQAAGHIEQVDTRSDVYTLGVILFYLLSGKYPHDIRGSALEVMKRISELEPCRLKDIEPRAERDLEALLTKTLARDPERRYGTAGDLAADLGRYLNGEPLVAQPPTFSYLFAKRVKKNRVPLSIAAVVLVTLAGVAVAAYIRVTIERNAAIAAHDSERLQRSEAQHQALLARDNAEKAQSSAELARQREAQATQSQTKAVASQKEAELAKGRADEERRAAELQLASSLVAQGDALGAGASWSEARSRYEEAQALCRKLGVSTGPADYGLWSVLAAAPPPLAGFSVGAGTSALLPDNRTGVVAGESPLSLRVFDLATGRILRRFGNLTDNHNSPEAVFAIDGGRQALYADHDGSMRIFDLSNGALVRSFGDNKLPGFNALAVDRDGRRAIQCIGRNVRIYDLADGRRVNSIHATINPRSVDWMPGGKAFLLGDDRHSVQLCDAADGHVILNFLGHEASVVAVAASPDGRLAASGDDRGIIRVWDLTTSRDVAAFSGHGGSVMTLAFAPDGRTLFSGGADGAVRLWQVPGFRLLRAVGPVSGLFSRAMITQDGRTIVTRSRGGAYSEQTWAVEEAHELRTLVQRGPGAAAALSSDGRPPLCAEGSQNLYDVQTGRIISRCSSSVDARNQLMLLPDRRTALAADFHRIVRWNLADGAVLPGNQSRVEPDLWAVALTPNGKYALGGDEQGRLNVWNLETGEPVAALGEAQKIGARVFGIAPSPDNRTVLACFKQDLRLWDVTTMQNRGSIGKIYAWAHCAAWSPDGRLAAIGVDYKPGQLPLRIWDMIALKELRVIPGISSTVESVTFSSDSAKLLCGFADGSVRLYDPITGQQLRNLGSHDAGVIGVAFSSDAMTAVSSAADGSVRVYDFSNTQTYSHPEAIAEAFKVMRHDHPDPASLATVGDWYATRRRWEWAAEFLEQARAAGKDVSALTLARCYWQMGAFKKAGAEFRKAVQRREADAAYLELCARTVDPLAMPAPTDSEREQAAESFAIQERDDEAIEQYSILLKKTPDDYDHLLRRSVLYSHSGRFQDACSDALHLIKTRADATDVIRLALLQLYVGDRTGYLRTIDSMYRKAESDPNFVDGFYRAWLCGPVSEADLARLQKWMERSVKQNGVLSSQMELSRALLEYRGGQYDSALQRLENLSHGTSRVEILIDLFTAMAWQQKGKPQAARDILAEATAKIRAAQPIFPPADRWAISDWLMVKIALREAEQLILGQQMQRPAIVPTTQAATAPSAAP